MSDGRKPSLHALTGLRFFAAAAVFYHHLGGKFGWEQNRYSIGSLAVTFFFILSGFVLTYVYHDQLANRKQVGRFLFNRFARIWPLHFFCLLLAAGLVWFDSRLTVEPFWQKFTLNLSLLQSWTPFSDWVFAFNGVAWSISTEAFFYGLFPLLMFAGARVRNVAIGIAFTVVALVVVFLNYLSQSDWQMLDYERIGHVNPIIRLPEFCCGVLAGRFFLRVRGNERPAKSPTNTNRIIWTFLEILIVAAIVALCYWITEQRFRLQITNAVWGSEFLGSWFRVAYPTLLMAIAVLVFAKSDGLTSQLLSARPTIYLGEISYAFYMIHFLVLRTINLASISYGQLSDWQIAALAFAISLGLSVLLHQLIELPAKGWLTGRYNKTSEPATRITSRMNRSLKTFAWLRIACAAAIAASSCLLLARAVPENSRTPQIAEIIQYSEPACRNVSFGGKVTLLGCMIESQADKQRIQVKLAWVKQFPLQHRRLVFVINEHGKQVARGMHSQAPFENAELGMEFVDKIFLPIDRLKQGHEVIICFRIKGEPPIRALSGNRRSYNQQLILLDPLRLAEMKSELSTD